MNCRDFHKHYVEILDAEADTPMRGELVTHLESCPQCAEFYDEMTRTFAALQPSHTIAASPEFKERVMDKIIEMEEAGFERSKSRRGIGVTIRRAAALLIALAVVVAAVDWIGKGGQAPVTAFSVLARAAEVMSGLKSVHIKTKMRTDAHDNFELVGPDYEFVEVDMWK